MSLTSETTNNNEMKTTDYKILRWHIPEIIAGLLVVIAALCLSVRPKKVRVLTLPEGGIIRLHYCPAGSFMMGSPDWEDGRDDEDQSRHRVTLKKGFWMGETEVTQGQWKEVMGGETILDLARKMLHDDTEYWPRSTNKTLRAKLGLLKNSNPALACAAPDDNVPVYYVSWADAARFCSMLTESERAIGRLPRGYEYRLPTEAEWEYACRAGSTTSLPNGKEIVILGENNAPSLDEIAWYGGNSSLDYHGGGPWKTDTWKERQYPIGNNAGPHPVAQKNPNTFGLYDMIGNVSEWCNTSFVDWKEKNTHRIRGGSWRSYVSLCRPAGRTWRPLTFRHEGVGFRVALAPILSQ